MAADACAVGALGVGRRHSRYRRWDSDYDVMMGLLLAKAGGEWYHGGKKTP
jgi:hypothetical protein